MGALMYYLCLLLSCWIVIHTFLICLVVGLKWFLRVTDCPIYFTGDWEWPNWFGVLWSGLEFGEISVTF